jgi:hypothetical protein
MTTSSRSIPVFGHSEQDIVDAYGEQDQSGFPVNGDSVYTIWTSRRSCRTYRLQRSDWVRPPGDCNVGRFEASGRTFLASSQA